MGNPVAPDERAAAVRSITSQLAELSGSRPRVATERGSVRIEVEVTAEAVRQWARLLEVLDRGSAFGVTDTAGGQIVWLRLDLTWGHRP